MNFQIGSILALFITSVFVTNASAAGGGDSTDSLVFPASYKVVSVPDGGTITGVVSFIGDAPELKNLEITKDVKVCGKTHKHDESLIVGDGNALKDAIVYLMDISSGAGFPEDAKMKYEIDQEGCQFAPHVNLLPLGQKLTMLNTDRIMHNIHIFSEVNKAYNKAQPKTRRKMRLPKVTKAEGPVAIKCDVHGWMKGWITYIPHPYFSISDENGKYKLENVPAGTYKLGYWQESCGTNKDAPVSVTVESGEVVTQNLALALQ